MNSHFQALNAFIEDTCVIAVIAYLLARGRVLVLLFSTEKRLNQKIVLGLLFGLIGLSEIVFPGARSPYVTHTLLVTFATLSGGFPVGVTSAITIACGALLLRSPVSPLDMGAALVVAAGLAEGIRLLFRSKYTLMRGFAAGAVVQAAVITANSRFHVITPATTPVSVEIMSAPANAFGVLLLQLIVNDARTRAEGERHRLEAERSYALVAESQLASLRARVHPHFLFNVLTSIAALCTISPEKAERAIVRLSQLMRRALEYGAASQQSLGDELEHVRAYLEIEQHRLGDRLTVVWEADYRGVLTKCPPFAIQTLVENAINHGIAPVMRCGTVRIVVRVRENHILIAVADDGAGMDRSARNDVVGPHVRREHGLEILNGQLALLYGPLCRLRLFSAENRGTLACFRLPSIGTISSK